MSTDAWIVVGIVLGALVLFASERVRPDVVGLLALVALGISRVVEPAEAFAGFANPAVTVARSFTDSFSGIQPEHAPGFILAQLLGAAIATWLIRWLLDESAE